MLGEDLYFKFLNVTEQAAVAAYGFLGLGDEKGADAAAVDIMRSVLNTMDIDGKIVIGEGERDKAPMLFIGEQVGRGGAQLDIAVDPLEGTTTCACYKPGAMSAIAVSEPGGLLMAPDVYMDKIAVGPDLPKGIISLKNDITTNLRNVSKAKDCDISDLSVMILKRERHLGLIEKLRKLGVRIKLLDDGDIGATLSLVDGDHDMYVGIGGAPEGVLSAVALVAVGGQMSGRLVLDTKELQDRAAGLGIKDFDKIYTERDLVRGDAFFVATGITSDSWMDGIAYDIEGRLVTDSVIFASTGVVARVRRTFFAHSRTV